MATITVKTRHNGNFQSVAQSAIDAFAKEDVFHVYFDFNGRVYKIDNKTTMQNLLRELANGGK